MNGLSQAPTYTPNTQRDQFEKTLINIWPRIYRFVNGIFYSLLRILKDAITRALQQIFRW